MPDDADREWDHQPFGQMPTLPNQWSDQQGSRMGGMQDVDLSVFQHDAYPATYGTTAVQMIPTGFGYYGSGLDLPACSDVEMHTPTTANFPLVASTEVSFTTISASYLQPPTTAHASLAAQSPKSVHSNLSPRPRLRYPNGQHAAPPTTTSLHHQQHRPAINRAATAPEPREPPPLKRNASSTSDAEPEDEDEEYIPVTETKSSRGGGAHRKRQRIPHTAVERRYRDNLNAHLDKLRLSVPAFTGGARGVVQGGSAAGSSAGAKSGGVGSGEAKPSKCEVLNGAIEHIGQVEMENRGLREEVQMLGARVEELERWCREGGRGGGRGGGFGGS
ncbi:hypothetical protein LTR35_015018 [Friedmanniomyces endolithicus]|uniref:BHLH domain-containing protein n=1 Tax=Friedmanniomyces endolithicus TaxID=329885 RepID=A0AAN6J2N7_9PEZI|nr:hypothetical protein LTR35_015018 [Friedmanniomyces endolithicus]KAK0286580.1 hypothetical protein LTS00_010249 [Friedmanniomyces endolithicus]KAK0310313.1 hypothetical protein LTR82_014840 [Friedmanniomyces endolithicus]KAK0982965.1 hypothetical protein LTR54_014530 [Friedmanniomyces endolithicus]